jgi:hypothetical protein
MMVYMRLPFEPRDSFDETIYTYGSENVRVKFTLKINCMRKWIAALKFQPKNAFI